MKKWQNVEFCLIYFIIELLIFLFLEIINRKARLPELIGLMTFVISPCSRLDQFKAYHYRFVWTVYMIPQSRLN